ncbi:MAG: aspartate kinase [Rikenellaceae bacterium]|nr:aspartate kinase [Rikenellaceae bacterium]MCL2691921.1 aspartate kinase [Rikenellaceae bacterium]
MVTVLKFGGTSVGSAANMRRVAEIITARKATVTVLSAMSGTTDALMSICAAARRGDQREQIAETVAALRAKYTECINDLLRDRQAAMELLHGALDKIGDAAAWYRSEVSEKLLIAQGELLTSAIFTMLLREAGHDAVLLHAPDFMVKTADGRVDMQAIQKKLSAAVNPAGNTLYITQGFVCTDAAGNIDNLGRGGSDYSAALIGAALGAGCVEIWTDIDGMHNNDPRYVSNTFPIRRMSFDEAAELAYFGAKILHPAAIQPCKDRGIPVLLKNTLDPSAEGTTICDVKEPDGATFHAVAAKDGITVVRIYSTRMLMAYGFLRQVFEVFERYRTPIDMITTSEVAVSLTIDDESHIAQIVGELQEFGTIEVERENTIVCVVGNMEHSTSGVAADILASVAQIPIKMISYGASHQSMAMLIATQHKRPFLQNLNDHLFPLAHA